MNKNIFNLIAYLLVASAILIDRYLAISEITLGLMYSLAIVFFIIGMIPKRIFENIRHFKIRILKRLHH